MRRHRAPRTNRQRTRSAGAGLAAPAVDCPHCGTRNEAEALFCEGCGYDFTTGQAPPPTEERDVVSAPVTAVEPVGWVVIVEVDPTWYDLPRGASRRALPAADVVDDPSWPARPL